MHKNMQKKVLVGTVRIRTKDLAVVEKTPQGWKKSPHSFPNAINVLKAFKANHSLTALIDTKNPQFLKGQSYKSQEQGARINILPDGQKLEKAFSLFSPRLQLHDQTSHDHWDVLYQNKGGTFSYVYTVEKRRQHRAQKYRKVDEFHTYLPTLQRNVSRALRREEDLALPMYTLLNTYMRIGNEIYYRTHGHKGLSTLMKKNIRIKGNGVTFEYRGKDGVPLTITKKFPSLYVRQLRSLLKQKKSTHFVFTKNDHPLHEDDFKKAFFHYCGKEFYPHIVRSHYATQAVKDFLKKHRTASKEQVDSLFYSIAAKLGHKRFNKKNQTWEDHYAVTVSSYIQPELAEKVKRLCS